MNKRFNILLKLSSLVKNGSFNKQIFVSLSNLRHIVKCPPRLSLLLKYQTKKVVIFGVLGISSATLLFKGYNLTKMKFEDNQTKIQLMDDSIFENFDDLLVFTVNNEEQWQEIKRDKNFKRLINIINNSCNNVKICYSKESKDICSSINILAFKGQRHKMLSLKNKSELLSTSEELINFYYPISEEILDKPKNIWIPNVTFKDFDKEVILKANKENPILLMLYEDSCFLCFLMRPFMNSIAKFFREKHIPFSFKKLNIDLNDFPKNCPISRGTPTFVLYTGDHNQLYLKWDEFKPRDLLEKLKTQLKVKNINEVNSLDYLFKLEHDSLYKRFQLFGMLILWTIQLKNLQDAILLSDKNINNNKKKGNDILLKQFNDLYNRGKKYLKYSEQPNNSKVESDTMKNSYIDNQNIIKEETQDSENTSTNLDFNYDDKEFKKTFDSLISLDMMRIDTLEENIEYLKSEIKSLMKDSKILADMLINI
ncbi:hypothetical protein ACR3K2_37190 [Cryptosporidium serpentis]